MYLTRGDTEQRQLEGNEPERMEERSKEYWEGRLIRWDTEIKGGERS